MTEHRDGLAPSYTGSSDTVGSASGTEGGRADLADLDLRPTVEIVRLMNGEDATIAAAIAPAEASIAAAIDAIAVRFRGGGRLVYVGAGTSGRLALGDAAEIGPTFGVEAGRVVAVVPGGDSLIGGDDMGVEDDPAAGRRDAHAADIGAEDAVVAVAASGSTPYVLAATERAVEAGALTVGIVCNEGTPLARLVDHPIEIVVGPEIIAGSTRLKAGTAQKMVLNTISTVTMVRAGKTYGNLMVDVRISNHKLHERAVGIIAAGSGADLDSARRALDEARGDIRSAIVALSVGIDVASARHRLESSDGDIRRAIAAADGARTPRAGSKPKRLGARSALVDGRVVQGDVEIDGEVISGIGLSPAGEGGLAIPGLVDLQVNGFAGVDFLTANPEELRQAGTELARGGVTAFQPTFISARESVLESALASLADARIDAPLLLGVHLEGPFLSEHRLGTHPPDARRDPDLQLMQRLLEPGLITYVTLAPELSGAGEMIDFLVERGITVACGHTNATAEQAYAAFDRGAKTITHLFNAMRPFRPRDPGIIGAAVARHDVTVQLIVDGRHVADEAVKMVWNAARGRFALVTDAVAAAGMTDGSYNFGDFTVEMRDGTVRRADGTLAGSALTMIEAIRNLHALGASLEDSIDAATRVPSLIIGRPDVGCLRVGERADIVVLDDGLQIERVLLNGREVQ